MHARLVRHLLAAALAGTMLGAPAWAQSSPEPEEPAGNWMKAPDKLPKVSRGDKTKNLDFLFEALKAAPDEDAAKLVEGRIWAIWFHSGSDTAELLMNRVKTAVDGKDMELGIRLLDAIIEIKPDYVEAW